MSGTGTTEKAATEKAATEKKSTLKAAVVFEGIAKRANAEIVKKVNGVFRFDITPDAGGAPEAWMVDLKNGDGRVYRPEPGVRGDCLILMKDTDFVALMSGKMGPQAAFLRGKLKVKGSAVLAQKLTALIPKKSKL